MEFCTICFWCTAEKATGMSNVSSVVPSLERNKGKGLSDEEHTYV